MPSPRPRPTRRALGAALAICAAVGGIGAEPFAHWDEQRLVLDNGKVRRVINLGRDALRTAELTLPGFPRNLVAAGADDIGEYSFTAGRIPRSAARGPRPGACRRESDASGGEGASVLTRWPDGLQVRVTYLLYPGLPVIRKHLDFINDGNADVMLENLDIEPLALSSEDTHAQVFSDYGRRAKLGPYRGDAHDALVVVQFLGDDPPTPSSSGLEARASWGIACGNESPGVTKRFAAFEKSGNRISIGLTRASEDYPFRKWLRPGESWRSPATFIVPYAGPRDPGAVLNGPVSDYVRRHLGTRLAAIPRRPTFVYNTWVPFGRNINEQLVLELAEAAAEMGFREFIIDDGWQANATPGGGPNPIGDWLVDREKFPRGLQPVFERIRALGMKPGLWFSLGAFSTTAAVATEHPEWLARDRAGQPINLHSVSNRSRVTACLATGWRERFRDTVLRFVRENGLAYIKLDLAVVTSAYTQDATLSGCHATDHPGHRDGPESYYAGYTALWELFDELHAAAPDLFIDCTFEAMGKLQLVDYAMCRHAEGNWLANYDEPPPGGAGRVRQMAWWRSPAIPAHALVIGNQQLDSDGWELSLQSLAGAMPVVLGDLRKIPAGRRQRVREWADWLDRNEAAHGCSLFRQDLPGFGEPAEGRWDGFARLNTETGTGGYVAVFRQNAAEAVRRVFVPGLPPDRSFALLRAPSAVPVATLTGRQLAEDGFEVRLPQPADGAIFTIQPAP